MHSLRPRMGEIRYELGSAPEIVLLSGTRCTENRTLKGTVLETLKGTVLSRYQNFQGGSIASKFDQLDGRLRKLGVLGVGPAQALVSPDSNPSLKRDPEQLRKMEIPAELLAT